MVKTIFLLFLLLSFSYEVKSQLIDNNLENEEAWIKKQMQEHHIPYEGVSIIRKGMLQQIKAYGEHRITKPAPFNTIIKVASLTKPVVAMLTLKLVNNGDWNLDDPMYKYWVVKMIQGVKS